MIEVENLRKSYGPYQALNDVSFKIGKGEVVGFLGPNGAGKTTTIQMLLDIITPTEGTIKIFGKEFRDSKEEILSRMNFSSPYVSLPVNLTAEENLLTFGRLYGVKDLRPKILELAKSFEIDHLLKKMTSSLSTGQLTRLNLAKAFVNDPELLLLDEPTASLDPDIVDKTLNILTKLQKEKGITVLYTSHNMAEIERICDHVVFINKGKIREEGTPQELVEKFGHKDLNDVFINIAREE